MKPPHLCDNQITIMNAVWLLYVTIVAASNNSFLQDPGVEPTPDLQSMQINNDTDPVDEKHSQTKEQRVKDLISMAAMTQKKGYLSLTPNQNMLSDIDTSPVLDEDAQQTAPKVDLMIKEFPYLKMLKSQPTHVEKDYQSLLSQSPQEILTKRQAPNHADSFTQLGLHSPPNFTWMRRSPQQLLPLSPESPINQPDLNMKQGLTGFLQPSGLHFPGLPKIPTLNFPGNNNPQLSTQAQSSTFQKPESMVSPFLSQPSSVFNQPLLPHLSDPSSGNHQDLPNFPGHPDLFHFPKPYQPAGPILPGLSQPGFPPLPNYANLEQLPGMHNTTPNSSSLHLHGKPNLPMNALHPNLPNVLGQTHNVGLPTIADLPAVPPPAVHPAGPYPSYFLKTPAP